MKLFASLVAAAVSLVALPAGAAQIYDAPPSLSGNQDWRGTLGLNFDVNAPVLVDQIGVFDSDGDGLDATLFVTIYDRVTGLALFDPVMFAAGTLNTTQAAYIFADLADLVLGPGKYQLAAYGYSDAEQNFNYGFIQQGDGGPITFNSLGGRLNAVGTSYSNTAGGLATIADNGTTRYGAGSFIATAVPEPSTWLTMLFGFGVLGSALRKRRNDTPRLRLA